MGVAIGLNCQDQTTFAVTEKGMKRMQNNRSCMDEKPCEHCEKISRREDGANATNIAYGSETVGARFAESLRGWRNRKTKKAI